MPNLLPPRSGGAFAAIDAAPTADVIFVAHTGLDDLITVGDVWRALPMEQVIKAKWWRVPADRGAPGAGRGRGLAFDWWERIDAWIAGQPSRVRPRPRSPNSDRARYLGGHRVRSSACLGVAATVIMVVEARDSRRWRA